MERVAKSLEDEYVSEDEDDVSNMDNSENEDQPKKTLGRRKMYADKPWKRPPSSIKDTTALSKDDEEQGTFTLDRKSVV